MRNALLPACRGVPEISDAALADLCAVRERVRVCHLPHLLQFLTLPSALPVGADWGGPVHWGTVPLALVRMLLEQRLTVARIRPAAGRGLSVVCGSKPRGALTPVLAPLARCAQDPACMSYSQALLHYKGFHAIQARTIGCSRVLARAFWAWQCACLRCWASCKAAEPAAAGLPAASQPGQATPARRCSACDNRVRSIDPPVQAHRIAHELWTRGRKVMAAALQVGGGPPVGRSRGSAA